MLTASATLAPTLDSDEACFSGSTATASGYPRVSATARTRSEGESRRPRQRSHSVPVVQRRSCRKRTRLPQCQLPAHRPGSQHPSSGEGRGANGGVKTGLRSLQGLQVGLVCAPANEDLIILKCSATTKGERSHTVSLLTSQPRGSLPHVQYYLHTEKAASITPSVHRPNRLCVAVAVGAMGGIGCACWRAGCWNGTGWSGPSASRRGQSGSSTTRADCRR